MSVREYVDEAIAGLSRGYYANAPEWDAAVADALPDLYSAHSIPDTHRLLAQLTTVAGGEHSFFSPPAEVAAWEQPHPSGQVPVPTVSYDGSIATVVIPAFSSAIDGEIDQYLEAAAEIFTSPRAHSACGWVLDVTANTGGDLRLMLVALSPLLDDGVIQRYRDRDGSTSDVVVDANTVSWEEEVWGTLPAGPTKLPKRPIGIVQGPATASAGESVIIAFTGQEGVRTFGAATGGFTTVNDGFELPDGAEVTLSFAVMGDRAGTFSEGPLEPDRVAARGESPHSSARDWVAEQCPGPAR